MKYVKNVVKPVPSVRVKKQNLTEAELAHIAGGGNRYNMVT
jgi:hypothetical protein